MLTKRILTTLLLLASCCRSTSQPAARPLEISDREFQRLALDLSEAPGFFDTDNLISNESSYLHVVPRLRKVTHAGGVYLGVGPDQNFSYIAAVEPVLGFVIDIRRENLLEHLYFKVLFEHSENRWQYLSALLGKPLPASGINWAASGREMVDTVRLLPSDSAEFEKTFGEAWMKLRDRFPELVLESDQPFLWHIASSFFQQNVDLKFRSHGRAPRSFYPTFGELITATDEEGQERNYLASESAYQLVRNLQLGNRIIPVVGNLAGQEALQRIARYLGDHQLKVSAFYLSNVEFYLFQDRSFGDFVVNLKALPLDPDALLIRSYFSYWRLPHPETVPGHAVTSLLQRASSLLEAFEANPYISYREMLFRYYEPR